jgi:hypothetical protein
MKHTISFGLALLVLGLASSGANAYWPVYYPPGDCCAPTCCVSYQTCVVTTYRPEWREEKVPIVVQKVNYRQEVVKVKVIVGVPQEFAQKVTSCYYVPVPKVVVQDVWDCTWVPVTLCDPCTGCPYVSCCPQWVTRKVAYTVCDYQLRSREDVVKVVCMVPQERIVDQARLVPVVTQEQAVTVRRYCVMVPCQTTVTIPVVSFCCPW